MKKNIDGFMLHIEYEGSKNELFIGEEGNTGVNFALDCSSDNICTEIADLIESYLLTNYYTKE